MKQINNLTIRHACGLPPSYYSVVTPEGSTLHTFGTFGSAKRYCQANHKFIKYPRLKNRGQQLLLHPSRGVFMPKEGVTTCPHCKSWTSYQILRKAKPESELDPWGCPLCRPEQYLHL